MYNTMYKIFAAALTVVGLTAVTGCSDKSDTPQDEWTGTYVYLQRIDYLSPAPKTFYFTHTAEGVTGAVDMPFVAKVQKPAGKDITVNVDFKEPEKYNLGLALQTKAGETVTTRQLVIKAGETHSDTLRLVATQVSKIDTIEQQVEIPFELTLKSVETAQPFTQISPVKDLKTLTAKISKSALQSLKIGEPENSVALDRSTWTITLGEGAENTGANLVDSNFGTDVARSNKGFDVTIDLGSTKTLTGLYTVSWSWTTSRYAPREIEVSVSDDNTTWKSLGSIATGTGLQYVTFLTRPKARYLKYNIVQMPTSRRVSIVEFYLYEADS